MSEAPKRAFCLTASVQADTRDDLADALRQMAYQIEREQLTVGISGGPRSGAIYELLTNPDQTHEKYFREVQDYLKSRTDTQPAQTQE